MTVAEPFCAVQDFKCTLERDVATSPAEQRLDKLLKGSADLERLILDDLHRSLTDLIEALAWHYATAAEVEKKRQYVMAACEEQLALLKRDYLPHLAREHGLEAQFASACKEPANRTVLGYARLADLEFALIVWRQNLKRDLASTPSKEDKAQLMRVGYVDAEALVKRCLNASHRAWNDLQRLQLRRGSMRSSSFGGGAPTYGQQRAAPSPRARMSFSDAPLGGDSVITVYERAMAQVWLRLEALAQQHAVADALQVFVRMDRASSHPLSFTAVAAAIKEVSEALDAGESPAVAEVKAQQVAEALAAREPDPDKAVSSVSASEE